MKLASAEGRWLVAASILGSGAVFLEGTVVNVALPAMVRDLHLGIAGLQWVVNAYLLTLSALMLLGGALGDRSRRSRVFALGALGFAAASGACALAPNLEVLVVCRLLQGIAGALLIPNSLALVESAFEGEERGSAIGQWAAGSAVSTAIGPLAGGLLVDTLSWRWVFAAVVPFGVASAAIALWRIPEAPRADKHTPLDWFGTVLVTLALAGVIGGLTAGPDLGFRSAEVIAALAGGVAFAAAFIVYEHRQQHPVLPLGIFRSREFSGANATTLLVYAGLSALLLLLMLQLQRVVGYSALEAGAAMLPVNAIMLAASAPAGRLAERVGARLPMTVGALIAAAGMALFTRVVPGASYVRGTLPAVIVFGCGLALFVAPLTSAVLGAVDPSQVGVASAVNNAVSRLGGLLATAVVPLAAGIAGGGALQPAVLSHGFVRGMWISAGLCAGGAAVAWATIGGSPPRKTS